MISSSRTSTVSEGIDIAHFRTHLLPIPGSEIEPTIGKNFLNALLIQAIKASDFH